MSILILGEAALRLAREYPERVSDHPELPWPEIQGLRKRIANGHFTIDPNILWQTVWVSIPDFLDKLAAIENPHVQGE